MLIVMDKDASPEMIEKVVAKIEALGFAAQPIPGGERVAIGKGNFVVMAGRWPWGCSWPCGCPSS